MGSLNLLWVFDKVNEAFYSSLIDSYRLKIVEIVPKVLQFCKLFRGGKDRRLPSGIASSTSYLALNGHSQNTLSSAVLPRVVGTAKLRLFCDWPVQCQIRSRRAYPTRGSAVLPSPEKFAKLKHVWYISAIFSR